MKINEIVNLDEAPGDRAGRRIGNAFGTLAKGVGAVAGGIAGAGRAAKKGFQQGRDVVGQGGDAPLDADGNPIKPGERGSPENPIDWPNNPEPDSGGSTGGSGGSTGGSGGSTGGSGGSTGGSGGSSGGSTGGSTGGAGPTGGDAGAETPSGPEDGMKATLDQKDKDGKPFKSNWTYNAQTGVWTDDKTGEVAKGKLSGDLFKSQGLNPDGTPAKRSIKQRVGDFFSGKSGGLAQATRKDPNSSIGRKIAGVAGAGIAKALGGPEPTAQGSQYTELPKEIKAQIDNLTKSEKNYLMDKLGQIDTSKRGEDNVQLVRGGGK